MLNTENSPQTIAQNTKDFVAKSNRKMTWWGNQGH